MKEDMSQRVHLCDNTFPFKLDSGCRIFTLSTCYVVVLKKKKGSSTTCSLGVGYRGGSGWEGGEVRRLLEGRAIMHF